MNSANVAIITMVLFYVFQTYRHRPIIRKWKHLL